MPRRIHLLTLTSTAALLGSTSGYATTYFTSDQVQAALFPGVTLTPRPRTLTTAETETIEKQAGVRVRKKELRVWQAPDGGLLLIDEVLGKHEYITFALALNPAGAVRQIEIMDYRESYGYQVRDDKWRAQFSEKTAAAPLKLDEDIKNISGATLSCRHITDGVKRLLVTYAVALKPSH